MVIGLFLLIFLVLCNPAQLGAERAVIIKVECRTVKSVFGAAKRHKKHKKNAR
jgi:hypothetical protein